ncbi:hypothetical protein [Amycolatopsis sp. NPDC058986]|uniref:hypothetical protein n=1 Tax=unclassified Amycolatopsis TaxID=2618356 RepID=UPI0036709748
MSADEVTEKLVGAVKAIPGLRPATPIAEEATTWLPWDWDGFAVELSAELVEIRLIATRLPLPPLLARATEAVRPLLAGTEWEKATLRLVVTDIDGAAFSGGQSDPGHTIGQ